MASSSGGVRSAGAFRPDPPRPAGRTPFDDHRARAVFVHGIEAVGSNDGVPLPPTPRRELADQVRVRAAHPDLITGLQPDEGELDEDVGPRIEAQAADRDVCR